MTIRKVDVSAITIITNVAYQQSDVCYTYFAISIHQRLLDKVNCRTFLDGYRFKMAYGRI